MIEIPENETIKTPDGQIYEIIPVPVEKMPLLLDFVDMRMEIGKLKEKEKRKGKNNKDDELISFSIKKALPAANKLIDAGTINESGKCLPEKYRSNQLIMRIADEIMVATNRGEVESKSEEDPLPQTEAEAKS